ncbi:MAG: hypothetical protein A2804_00590 [Candidatus Pacebacteria bacterium RIFCSPHIGHO2_01_FULL_46_10]|nr:MAG: hypothetical protein A2804_00590 [Candidatus Pacebacteria bacterium RIFCSPHIGHO2_01_FULL_46_10]
MAKNTSVIVETVVPLSTQQAQTLKVMLKKSFGTEEYTTELNPEILGGVRVRVGSTLYDASLRGKLEQLRTS